MCHFLAFTDGKVLPYELPLGGKAGLKLKTQPVLMTKLKIRFAAWFFASAATLACATAVDAAMIYVPNASFESPVVGPVSPYATPDIDFWQKSAQPVWYEPTNNADTPWQYLMGTFYNVSSPGQFIDNCDGNQACFLFALPEAALFQDYGSIGGSNSVPSHAFDATFGLGKSYTLTVGVIGGGGGMSPGVTLQLSLYYRDNSGRFVTVAATSITNSSVAFPTNTHFVDYQVQVPVVSTADPWAGKKIGIQLLSTTGFDLAGGYWDVDNVRLTETIAPQLNITQISGNQIRLGLVSEAGMAFEIQGATDLAGGPGTWTSLGTLTNTTGVASLPETIGGAAQRFYRARQL